MPLYKTKGIVLRTIKLGEADKIVTVLSNTRGKVKAVAKGVRRTTSKFGGRLEPFTYLDLLLYEGRELDIITQAEIISSFREIREDFDKVGYGSAMLELVDRVALEGERESKLFGLLLAALKALSGARDNLQSLLMAFDIKLMAISGYLPNLFSCVICGATPGTKKITFSCEWGGILCERCGVADLNSLLISPSVADLLDRLLKTKMEDSPGVEMTKVERKQLSDAVQAHVNYHVQARLRSREYLSKSARGKSEGEDRRSECPLT